MPLDIFIENSWQAKGSRSQKVFLSDRKIRNLLGSRFTNWHFVQILQKLIAVFYNLKIFPSDFQNCNNFCAGNLFPPKTKLYSVEQISIPAISSGLFKPAFPVQCSNQLSYRVKL
jgi:hypothetical protein